MTRQLDISSFHFGETIEFTLAAKNRDGSVITAPPSQKITFLMGETDGGAPIIEKSGAPTIVLTDEPTGVWLVSLPASAYTSLLDEDTLYYYNITSTYPGDDPIVQRYGKFPFKPSLNWS